ncbi:MAG: DUF5916 domain-containing protein [Gemmatimonadales bacterium]
MLLPLAILLQAQSTAVTPRPELMHANGRVPRSIAAVPTTAPPRIDGKLDDAVWGTVTPERGFRRDVPSDGKPATQDTEVRVVYDRDALYVSARLYDDRPDLISRRLNRRDSFSAFNDIFFVMLDPHHDHQTQVVFGVTAAGERRDAIRTNDGQSGLDIGWDPVWEAATTIDSLGWVAEMRIPFSQLRFSSAEGQAWGIQFRRDNVRAGEAVDWEWSPATEPGTASKAGHLLGLKDIAAPKRVELLPYVSSQAQLTQGIPPGNPFDDGSVTSATAGLDLKYGISSAFTLNATINPDFGQVEADPSVVNLTAFETFFEERRPFFVEGANLFSFSGTFGSDRFFYSRRVGRAPTLSALGRAPYVDQPTSSAILGAGKLSGRTSSGWSIGVLNAVTRAEYARTADLPSGSPIGRIPIEPLSNYTVARVQRDLNRGASGFGFILTGVQRDADSIDFASLRSSAVVGGADFFHRWRRNTYQLSGNVGVSRVAGSAEAIALTQLASARYYQRPDQDYVTLDPSRTSLSGYTAQVQLDKLGGDWTYGVGLNASSPGFEINDAGFQLEADRIRLVSLVTRNWVRPTRLSRRASLGLRLNHFVNFGGDGPGPAFDAIASLSTHALSSLSLSAGYQLPGQDDRATRGGPLIRAPGKVNATAIYSLDSRKVVSGRLRAQWSAADDGTDTFLGEIRTVIQTRPGHSVSITPIYTRQNYRAFYTAGYADQTATETFGRRYVFAPLVQQGLAVQTRLEFYFTPALSLQLYAEPFVASARFASPEQLLRARGGDFAQFGSGSSTLVRNPDNGTMTIDADGGGPAPAFTYSDPSFSIRSLRSNVVLRWEYRPGSTLFLVWNQNRANLDRDPRFRALRDLGNIFGDDMRNVLLVKGNYYFSL